MSIITSILIILVETLIYIFCAPKIGPVLFDPLVYESQNSMKIDDKVTEDASDDWLTPALPSKKSSEELKKPCQSYDYDINQCKYVKDRKICGYDKNRGDITTDEIIDVGNGCRIRNDRLECGYLIPPFNLPRRPPANEELDNSPIERVRSSAEKSRKTTFFIANTNDTTPKMRSNEDDIQVNVGKRYLSKSTADTGKTTSKKVKSETVPQTDMKTKKPKKYCVERNDRIFCYTLTTIN